MSRQLFQSQITPDPNSGQMPKQEGAFIFQQQVSTPGVTGTKVVGVGLVPAPGYFILLTGLFCLNINTGLYLYPTTFPADGIPADVIAKSQTGVELQSNFNSSNAYGLFRFPVDISKRIVPVTTATSQASVYTISISGIQLLDCPDNWKLI